MTDILKDEASLAKEALTGISDILAGLFKRGDGDLVEISLSDMKGSEEVYTNDKLRILLTHILKDRHNLYLCIEASYKNIFIMSEPYFNDVTQGSLQLDTEAFNKGLNTFGNYENFMKFLNDQETLKN